jgi:hypothetical protein
MRNQITVLFLTLVLAACQSGRDDDRFYSYVDAQGNLVTIENDPSASDSPPGEGEPPAGKRLDGESYQTTDQVEAKLEELERDRFVTWLGPDGEVVRRPLDPVAEREAAENRPEEFTAAPQPAGYIETMTRVPADCCAYLIDSAGALALGEAERIAFTADRIQWLALDESRPAVTLELDGEIGALQLQSFIRDGRWVMPGIMFLDEDGVPVLVVDKAFTRHYPETWFRYGYMESRLRRETDFAYMVLFLPYAGRDEDRILLHQTEPRGGDDFELALDGELLVTGRPRNFMAAP